jgi:hypothetical protein
MIALAIFTASALSLSVSVFNLRLAVEGYEDEFGFHFARKSRVAGRPASDTDAPDQLDYAVQFDGPITP